MVFSPRLTAALEYASRGIPIFPLWPGTKDPISVHMYKPGYRDHFEAATTDHATIRAWFETLGDCNIGWEPERIGCGLADIDIKKGVDGRDAWFELRGPTAELTPTIITPSGGLHYLYKGSLPGTHNAMGEGIDTRGRRSYGIFPPSVTPEGEYSFLIDLGQPFAPMPERVVEFFANRRSIVNRMEAPEGLVLDRPWNIQRAELHLRRLVDSGFVAGPGNRDVPCFQVACQMLEYGLSEDTAAALIHEIWEPGCDGLTENKPLLVEEKIASASRPGGMQNAIGCRALPEGLAARVPASAAPQPHRFRVYTPEEHAALPPLEFWDDKHILPKIANGCAIVVYGPQGSHKSGVLLKELADVALRKGAKVLYVAAEGAHGIGTARLPALMRHRGRPLSELTGKWLTMDAAPDVLNPVDMQALHQQLADLDFRPDFIVFDTGTRCIGMADINNTAVGTMAIKGMEEAGRPYNATVFYVTHPGKDTERGAIGSKQQENQAFGQYIIANDGLGNITLTVEKLKEGRAHFTVPFRVADPDSVPVIVDLAPEEIARRSRTEDEVHDELREDVWRVVYPVLQGGSVISRTNRGSHGLPFIHLKLADLGRGGVGEDAIKAALVRLLADDRLAAAGAETFKFGNAAQAPTSLQK